MRDLVPLVLRYTALRIALFAVPFLLLLLLPIPVIVAVALALVLSSVAALYVGRPLMLRMGEAWRAR